MKDLRYKELQRLESEMAKFKVTCKCGTKTIMIDKERDTCRGCGHWIYKNKLIEFKYKMEELRRNQK